MPDDLEARLTALALLGMLAGLLGTWLARSGHGRGQTWGGYLLVALTLVALTAGSVVAATHRADGLVPLGLIAGLLVVVMLWEAPVERRASTVPLGWGEET